MKQGDFIYNRKKHTQMFNSLLHLELKYDLDKGKKSILWYNGDSVLNRLMVCVEQTDFSACNVFAQVWTQHI